MTARHDARRSVAVRLTSMLARPASAAIALAVVGGVLAACTAPKSEVCRRVCGRESECIESTPTGESSFDESECITACAALERDADGRGWVAIHAACVDKAATCPQVLECK
jgi:hypothetical protein